MLGFFRRKKHYAHPKKRVSQTNKLAFVPKKKAIHADQLRVLRALDRLTYRLGRPVHYRELSKHMNVIEGVVTPRIAELRSKNYVKVAYIKKGLGKLPCNHYAVTAKGYRKLMDEYTDLD